MCFDELYPSQLLDWTHTESETGFQNVLYNAKYHCHPYILPYLVIFSKRKRKQGVIIISVVHAVKDKEALCDP